VTNKPYALPITVAQCRAARGLLHWTQDKLAFEALIAPSTVRAFELEKYVPHPNNVAAIKRALEARGVRFTERGVEL
jgi:DNA-binding XRE family transcriptional regulator